jgi:hypothetical protein
LLIRAFTGVYWDNHKDGTYRCVVCNQELFSSSTKFDSGSGWPSFYDIIQYGAVKENVDTSLGVRRTEIVCAQVEFRADEQLFHKFFSTPYLKARLFRRKKKLSTFSCVRLKIYVLYKYTPILYAIQSSSDSLEHKNDLLYQLKATCSFFFPSAELI